MKILVFKDGDKLITDEKVDMTGRQSVLQQMSDVLGVRQEAKQLQKEGFLFYRQDNLDNLTADPAQQILNLDNVRDEDVVLALRPMQGG